MESLLVIRSVAVTNTRAPPCCGASAPHFAEHHITLLFLSSLPPSSVRLHRTSPTSLCAPLRTRAYNFHRARWRDVSRRGKTRGNASTCDMRACHQSKTAPAKSIGPYHRKPRLLLVRICYAHMRAKFTLLWEEGEIRPAISGNREARAHFVPASSCPK